ncbi:MULTISPECIES: hypothetical protein [Okeania]|uniref:hypothetical protein n=1 Tax=Okeania TaxID=1458928 RepID=UPI001374CFF8|nr:MULTISPECIES: hypothetical protein [Okeania]NEP07330.1 hypothetical protein [Okeania sp. SIO4D6]NEP39756.1 hypothetical protein [Okeania sp. SIO2H7]NEP75112.1 hypothetical protein [Okeania sp. SIO2G5]NEP93188.1 hypothetical protein [Okeania sp. SIO2F5]NEQ90572.1 hypothetical protein [Okeania sp. SIO2G4]
MSLYLFIDISIVISTILSRNICSWQLNYSTSNTQKSFAQVRVYCDERGSGRGEA